MFGKGDIKKMGISPDGYIQMALQLAYYKVMYTYMGVCRMGLCGMSVCGMGVGWEYNIIC